MNNCITVCILIILSVVHYSSCEPIVQIGNSNIIGQNIPFRGTTVNQFLSVPYAQPPLGELRFKKPEPIQNYPKELHAFKFPPACPQYSKDPFPWYDNSTDKSEDCLYLNIWTPSDASPDNKKAVFYWVFSGGLRYGSNRLPVYNGVPLAALGDIIVVTVNYRVGPFGFFTSGTDDAPGNVGLYDTLEGLKWVNKYIGYFGGDTSRITISGESAGSITVGFLAVSPLAKGLYQRQIMESGSGAFLIPDPNPIFGQNLAEKVGCASSTFTLKDNPEEVVKCLRKVDAAELAEADYSLNPHSTISFAPIHGDELLPSNPRISIMNGDFRCTDLLIGNTHDEGSYMLSSSHPEMFGFYGEKDTLFNKSVGEDLIRKAFAFFPDPESVVKHYLPDSLPEEPSDKIRYQTYTAMGDALTLCPTVYQAEKCAQIGGNVYYYFWTHRPSTTPWAKWQGVAHFTEVQFVFGSPLLHPSDYTEEEHQISEQLIEIWSSFTKDGKPSIPWPLYSKENPVTKVLGPGFAKGKSDIGPHKKNCDFLQPFFEADK